MKGYIYKIENKINKRCYIGQTTMTKVEYRWNNHISELNKNKHHNDYLQNAWNKYGEENFVFEIILEINENSNTDLLNNLNKNEILYIKEYKSMYYENGYNLKEGGRYSKLTDYSKQKISKANSGKIRSIESKEKNRIAHLGKKWTTEQKNNLKNIRKSMKHPQKGKPRTQEEKDKISKALLKENYKNFSNDEKFDILNQFYIEKKYLKDIAAYYNTSQGNIVNVRNKFLNELDENYQQYYLNYYKTAKKNIPKQKVISEEKRNVEQMIIKDYEYNNYTIKKLSDKYKYSNYMIKSILTNNNIKIKKYHNEITFSQIEINDIINAWNNNLTLKQIGKLYNTSSKPIAKVLKNNNIDINPNNKGKKKYFL